MELGCDLPERLIPSGSDLQGCATQIATRLLTQPTIFLVGAGFSLPAGLPSARDFTEATLDVILRAPISQKFLEAHKIEKSVLRNELAQISFDVFLGLLTAVQISREQLLG